MLTFSTTLQVRRDAGFYGNPNVSDEQIDEIRKQAYDICRGIIAGRYNIANIVPGGTGFDGSQAAGLLERAEILVAAGYLLSQEFGEEQMGQDFDGEKKIKSGKELLFQLFDSKNPIRLIDATGQEFPRVSVATESNDNGIVITISNTPRAFTIDQVF